MTSLTTLIALIALFVLGGDVIRGFVFAMIWGVIVGDVFFGLHGIGRAVSLWREARLVESVRRHGRHTIRS